MIETDPEFLALMAACRERPADDAPRLILSDWLEEHDEEPWAELIRVECEAEHTAAGATRAELRERADDLIYRCWLGWFGPLISALDRLPRAMAAMRISPLTAVEFRDIELLRRAPVSEWEWPYRYSGFSLQFPDVLWSDRGLPALLVKWDSLRDPRIGAWFDTPPAARLWQTFTELGGEDTRLPVGPLGVPAGLRPSLSLSLLLKDDPPQKMVLPPLTQPPAADPARPRPAGTLGACLARLNDTAFWEEDFPSVYSLSVRTDHPDTVLPPFPASVDISRLIHFDSRERHGDVTLPLLGGNVFDRLESLSLGADRSLGLGEAVCDAAEAGLFPQLTHAFFPMGWSAAERRRFLGSPCRQTLRDIDLSCSSLTAADLQEIIDVGLLDRILAEAARVSLTQPFKLNVCHNPLGDAGARVLAASPVLASVVWLNLTNTDLGDDGLAAILNSPFGGHLRRLTLSYNRITEAGEAPLRALPNIEWYELMRGTPPWAGLRQL